MKSIARTWLDAAITDDPMTTGIRLNEGEFFALTGDRANAERTFRSVLAVDPLGAGQHERVLISTDGSFTRAHVKDPKSPLRNIVMGIVDEPETR
jgi:microcompartment protein CcmK/EutM